MSSRQEGREEREVKGMDGLCKLPPLPPTQYIPRPARRYEHDDGDERRFAPPAVEELLVPSRSEASEGEPAEGDPREEKCRELIERGEEFRGVCERRRGDGGCSTWRGRRGRRSGWG